MFPYEKAMKLLSLYPDELWYAEVEGYAVLEKGTVMQGFLLPGDNITRFERFS